MAAKRNLRVATDADAPPAKPAKPQTLAEAVEAGDYLNILKAQRRQMVADVASTTGPALAALHRQIALHSKEIAGLEAAAKEEADESAEVPDEEFDSEAI
jgi:hypothetical protein